MFIAGSTGRRTIVTKSKSKPTTPSKARTIAKAKPKAPTKSIAQPAAKPAAKVAVKLVKRPADVRRPLPTRAKAGVTELQRPTVSKPSRATGRIVKPPVTRPVSPARKGSAHHAPRRPEAKPVPHRPSKSVPHRPSTRPNPGLVALPYRSGAQAKPASHALVDRPSASRGAAAGVGAAVRQVARTSNPLSRIGGSDAVKVVDVIKRGEHSRITPYGKSPWRGKVLEVEVVNPAKLAPGGRLHTGAGESRFGRWGALADDVRGLTPGQLNRRFNLDAAKGAGQLPDRFSARVPQAGDRFRIGTEGAKRSGLSRFARKPLQLEYLDYPGRNATGAARSGYLNRFAAPSSLDDAGRSAALIDDVARIGVGGADDVARGARALGAARSLGRVAGKAALPLAIAVASFDVFSTWRAEGGFGPETRKALGRGVGGIAGGAAGGALVGAAIGSVVPGVGTVIGGALGGIVGGIAGSKLGEWFAVDGVKAVSGAASKVEDAVGDVAGGAAGVVSGAAKALGGLFG